MKIVSQCFKKCAFCALYKCARRGLISLFLTQHEMGAMMFKGHMPEILGEVPFIWKWVVLSVKETT